MSGKNIKLGIDPGLAGAIAILQGDELVAVYDMPIMAGTGKRQQVNAAELVRILSGYEISAAYVERVSAFPGQGVSSMFSFGTSYGIIIGVLAALSIPMVLVSPQSWKAKAGLRGKDKDFSRTLAQQLYPQAPLGRKKDIGKADAILIAKFGGIS